MLEFGIIIIIVLIAISILGLFFKAFKVISTILGIMIVAFSLFSYIVYRDAAKLQEAWPGSEKLMIVIGDNGEVLSAISGKLGDENDIHVLDDNALNSISSMVASQNLENGFDEYYKIIVVNKYAFRSVKSIGFGSFNLTRAEIFKQIDDEKQLTRYLTDEMNTTGQVRALMLFSLLSEAMAKDDLFLISGLKENTVQIYPKSLVFYVVDILPKSQIERVIKLE